MPDSITAQLVNSAWDTIEEAVTSGLAMAVPYAEPRPALDTTFVVSAEKLSETNDWRWARIPNAPPHVRVEESGDAVDIMHHYCLNYHDLRSPDTDSIKEWAAKARRFELALALWRYTERATRRRYAAADLCRADPDGWGERRCVVFNSDGRAPIPDRWDQTDLERTVKIDAEPMDGLQGLVFRIGGGPYIRRPADLTLGWAPDASYKAELLLTEQLEFVNVAANTVIAVEMSLPPVH